MENQLETQNSELNNEMAQRLAKLDEIRKTVSLFLTISAEITSHQIYTAFMMIKIRRLLKLRNT